MRRELVCLAPSSPPKFQVRDGAMPDARRAEVLVRLEATSVNPIDAKHASGYGRRLLSLKGAGQFPMVLGNDLVGRVEAVGPGVADFAPGQRVFGLVGAGKRGGAHASHVVVPEVLLRPARDDVQAAALAVLPYSFTTMWLAVRSIGLTRSNASGKKVLVLGAAGALGRLALQLLSTWGCFVTAVCAVGTTQECRELGASAAVERGPQSLGSLPADFDATLNFASWDEEIALASRLGAHALGQATTVHPLLGYFDRLGWLPGALASRRDFAGVRQAVRLRSPSARYTWTVFKPEPEALNALEAGLHAGQLSLPVGLCVPLNRAEAAFAHVAGGKRGRAVLLP